MSRLLAALETPSDGDLRTLLHLRWLVGAAQVVTILFTALVWDVGLPTVWMLAIASGTLISNLVLLFFPPPVRGELTAAAVLVFDALVLTALLALSGGPSNPFSVVYLIYVTFAAVILRSYSRWVVVFACVLAYAALFFVHQGGAHSAHSGFSAHLQGMWVALAVTAIMITVMVSQLTGALESERRRRAKTNRLLAMTTLAAGAAHELGNPLGTIKLVASELEDELRNRDLPESLVEDTRMILQEVDRSRRVLETLALGAGELAGESLRGVQLEALISELRDQLGEDSERVDWSADTPKTTARLPVQATVRAILQVLRNGLDASSSDGRVQVDLRAAGDQIEIHVKDQGVGMSPATLERLGEPFFTTKPVGSGMGLGVFLARAFVTQLDGTFDAQSQLGEGTTITMTLPRTAR